MMNKKATIADEVVLFIPRIIFMIAVIFSFVILIKVLIVTKIDIKQIETEILVKRLLLSQGSLSYYDKDIERLYPGIIDLARFKTISQNNPTLLDDEIISYGNDNLIIAAKITLKRENENDISIFYNQEGFDNWQPKIGIESGSGKVDVFEDTVYVLVKDVNGLSPAKLDFFVIS